MAMPDRWGLEGFNFGHYSPIAGLTTMGSVSGELSLSPASPTDFTQNTYSFPGCSPGTVNLGEQMNLFVFACAEVNSAETDSDTL